MMKQKDILSNIEINRDGDQIITKVPLRFTEAKLEVLCEVVKAWQTDLAEIIQDAVDHDIRALLEGSSVLNPSDVGEALNKVMCDQWLKEIGEAPDSDKT